MVHAFYVLPRKTIANRNFQRFFLLEVLYFYHYNCEAFQENFCVLYICVMFSFSSRISSGSNTICYRFFFSAIELLWDHWQTSVDHICTDFLLDSLFCSVNHLIYLLFHQGHAVLIIIASFLIVQSLNHVWLFATPHTALCQTSLSFTISGACWNPHPLSQWCHPTT